MKIAGVLGLALGVLAAQAEIRLPNALSDHAVLQRNAPIHIWGWATPNVALKVSFHHQTVEAHGNALGEWSAWLAPEAAGGPYTLTVEGDGTLTRNDLLVGDVWLASGQSNMEMPLKGFAASPLKDSAKEIAAATHPSIRLLLVKNVSADFPLPDIQGTWTECTPQTAAEFSAVGYLFAAEISAKENVPVGIIDSTWGGTPADAWTSLDTLANNPQLQPAFAARATFANAETQREEQAKINAAEDAAATAAGKPKPWHAWVPSERGWVPAGLYNGMIAPLTPMSIKGAIWYQGETNSSPDRYRYYATLFPAMIADWRMHFAQGDFPFLFVQIASYANAQDHWGTVRDAQRRTLSLRNTAMAVTIDVGEPHNIHPGDKQTVAARLALAARAMVYREKVEYVSPEFRQVTAAPGGLRVWFDHAEGLQSRGPLSGFEVAGADRHFVPAEARIDGDTVIVSAATLAQPVFVRYAWRNDDKGSLYNAAGLPAGTFTSEDNPLE